MNNNRNLKKVLIVDDEEDMIWSLQKNLNNENLHVDISVASSGEDALEVLARKPIDLVVTDIKMPGISGMELLMKITARYPKTGVIVMTAFPSPEHKNEAMSRGGLHYLEKPFDINELRSVIKTALTQEDLFKGTVAGIELSDIIQINCLSKAVSALKVKTVGREGIIYFNQGSIVHAECGDQSPEEAFYEILTFRGGVLESISLNEPPETTITKDTQALLLEGATRLDEKKNKAANGNGAAEPAPAVDTPSNTEPDAEHAEDAENTHNTQNTKNAANAEHSEDIDDGDDTEEEIDQEDDYMDGLKKLLSEFTNLPGVNTACLVGRDGFLLDSIAIAGTDSEMIGAIASSGFGASESMGTQLQKGSLTMTMIEYAGGPVMLAPVGAEAFLVVVADQEANLGMIRLKIKKHAAEIEKTASI